ncbi:Cell division protein BolA [hydrothermal vent metagenome]|uniref:Cell division protein BolA n=1 Tax=hydrothermal vent metagenome TaxID=652676 RepID=A0A3B0YER6_9ZZZZ
MIEKCLTEAFAPQNLGIVDESHKHVGHASAGGAGHFAVDIVADAFAEKTLIQRHRLVYNALGDAMTTEIHALSIKASTPAEAGI